MALTHCRADPAAEYSRKLEYLKREEELIKEEELEAEALLQPSGESLQVGSPVLLLSVVPVRPYLWPCSFMLDDGLQNIPSTV